MVIKLTSPPIKSDHVEAFQRALTNKGYYHGAIDGVYGELTAQAVYRAKYWEGYNKPDKTAGDLLYNVLTGNTKRTVQMENRRKARLKAKPKTPLRAKAFTEAKKHVGEKERTGNNDIKYADWYGIRGPWCAMFVTWCYIKAGSKVFTRGSKYAYVPFIVADARRGINGLTLTKEPQTGDIVCFDWEGNGVADHTGLFEKWIDRKKGIFSSVEGNTSGDDSGSQSNGGMVAHRNKFPRNVSNVQAFVHVAR